MYVILWLSVSDGTHSVLTRCQFCCRYGLLYFVTVNTLFNNVAAMELFINERIIFMWAFRPVDVFFHTCVKSMRNLLPWSCLIWLILHIIFTAVYEVINFNFSHYLARTGFTWWGDWECILKVTNKRETLIFCCIWCIHSLAIIWNEIA